jgi:hypothetical protein
LREALLAGLKTTISQPKDKAKQAQKMAIEKVLPNLRGVEIKTSEEHLSQSFSNIMSGRLVAQSFL